MKKLQRMPIAIVGALMSSLPPMWRHEPPAIVNSDIGFTKIRLDEFELIGRRVPNWEQAIIDKAKAKRERKARK